MSQLTIASDPTLPLEDVDGNEVDPQTTITRVGGWDNSIENVFGGAASDAVTGDLDHNILGDGPSNDSVWGGLGNDRFMLELGAGTSGNPDHVYDEANPVEGAVDQDTLDFTRFDSGTGEGVVVDMDELDVAQQLLPGTGCS